VADRVSKNAPRPRPPGGQSAPLEAVEHLLRLRQEAERIVAEAFGQAAGGEQGPRIPADVYEGDDAFRISLEVPGVKRQDLGLFVVGSSLVVEGRKREVHEERVVFECAERAYGSFRRVIDLPGVVDASRIEARLERGVLTITLPRIAERRGRRQEVSIG
jgi:HSP20 family protein